MARQRAKPAKTQRALDAARIADLQSACVCQGAGCRWLHGCRCANMRQVTDQTLGLVRQAVKCCNAELCITYQ